MKKTEVVPRFLIKGKYYTEDEISGEKREKIISERVNQALERMHYRKDKKGGP